MSQIDHDKPESAEATPPQLLKLAVELGPLLAFFAAYLAGGIYWATGVIMVATVLAIVASKVLFQRVPPMLVVTAVIVGVFGALTFLLHDPRFFKMKPTMVNLAFAGALAFGLATDRPLFKNLLGNAFNLTDEGWRQLTIRWMLFFLAMAGLNEFVWRTFPEATWVNFKVFGILLLTMLFALMQMGLLKKHELDKH